MTTPRQPDIRKYAVLARTRKFARRVERAQGALRQAAAEGPLFVSTSWGKDSVACCGLALETLGPVPMVHLASSYELPGYDETIAYFRSRTEVITLPVPKSADEMIAWLKDVGLGYERDSQIGSGKRRKANAIDQWGNEHGYPVQALGLRKYESPGRTMRRVRYGLTHTRQDGRTICTPIADWAASDVWSYIVSRGLPYNRRIYDAETHGMTRETIRNSGWLTTVGTRRGRIAWLRTHFPAEYRRLAEAFPHVRLHT